MVTVVREASVARYSIKFRGSDQGDGVLTVVLPKPASQRITPADCVARCPMTTWPNPKLGFLPDTSCLGLGAEC
jgi:hypothetical protein